MEEAIKILPRYRVPVVKKTNRRKKTHEEYVAEVAVKNPNIEVVGRYIDANTKIEHRCLIDGCVWDVTPNKVLSAGRGCPKCAGNYRRNHQEYVEELLIKNPNLEVVEKYIGANTKIKHHCLKHDVYWYITPSSALSGTGCPECGKEKISIKNSRTEQQYVEEVKIISPHITVLGSYVNSFTPILHKCNIHNIEWMVCPQSILNGSGCYYCGLEKLSVQKVKTHEQYVNDLKTINPNIIPIEKYAGALVSILHRCIIDNYEWYLRPANAISGRGCPKCSNHVVRTQDEYVDELSTINENIELVDRYIDTRTPVLHKCKIDGYIWKVRPADILCKGYGCPRCHESKGERKIRLWLEKHNIDYNFQYPFENCRDNKPLPFDFYLPDYNSCIEYDGKQHFESIEYFGGQESFEITVKHDNIKNEYCKDNGILLLRIPYFKNVEEELNNFLFI